MNKTRKMKQRIQVMAMVGILIISTVLYSKTANAAKADLCYLTFSIDGESTFSIPAYEMNYVNNVYLSLRELSKSLSGTSKQFLFYNNADGAFQIVTGMPYDASLEPVIETEEGENETAEYQRPEVTYLAEGAYWTQKDGSDVVYYTYADWTIEDLYMSLLDTAMMLDLDIQYENGVYNINLDGHFSADLEELKEKGYFDYLHSALLGDATTGEILFSSNGDEAVPIASTTKLMTYFITERMIELGKIQEDDIVTISANAARLSTSDDTIIYMYEGEETTVRELLNAMLIQSSNESALALAEYVAGSQEAFVEMMNKMAFLLDMESAVFYNPHGLPEYFSGEIVTMVENKVSAEDMFKLARAILNKYPQVEEITSVKEMWLDYLYTSVYTTNSLMYNMEDVFGLKTGTTDAAGSCLISARRVTIDGEEHILTAIVMGAESNADRFEMSELLLKSVGY